MSDALHVERKWWPTKNVNNVVDIEQAMVEPQPAAFSGVEENGLCEPVLTNPLPVQLRSRKAPKIFWGEISLLGLDDRMFFLPHWSAVTRPRLEQGQ